MQHKTHTDSPSKSKDQQKSAPSSGNQRSATDNKGKGGMQNQQNKPGNANGNQQNDRSQSK